MQFQKSSLLSVLILGSSCLGVLAEDWPHWRGPNYTGISTEKKWNAQWPATGPKQLWKAKVGIGFSSVSVSEGQVFTMGNENDADTIFCFDAATGKEIWKRSYDCPLDPKYYEGGTSVTPTVSGKNVFTLSRKGDVFCLEKATGKVVWSKNIAMEIGAEVPTWGFAGSPFIDGDRVILNVGTAGVALNKNTGKMLWSTGKAAAGYSTPVPKTYGGKPCVVLCNFQSVSAVEIKTGEKVWEQEWKTRYDVNAADPIIVDDTVFISTGYERGCALLQIKDNKPTILWENKNMKNHLNGSVTLDCFIYGVDGNAGSRAKLKCIELKTGTVKWTEEGLGSGSLMMADNKLIVLSDKGELVVAPVSPEAFKPISRAQVLTGKCWTVPVLANGRIYCRNAAGDLVCVDAK